MRSNARALVGVLTGLSLMTTGCVLSPGWNQPDELALTNGRTTEVTALVTIHDGTGREVVNLTMTAPPGSTTTEVMERLSGTHLVRVSIGSETKEQQVRLETVRDYVNVYVEAGTIGIATIHGD